MDQLTKARNRDRVYQWKKHEVTEFLIKEFRERHKNIIDSLSSRNIVKAEELAEINFALGQKSILAEFVDDEFYEELVDSITDQEEGEEDE